ncbi:MAG: hypothetical protein AB1757_06850 [Acidobacteriota bacterium]
MKGGKRKGAGRKKGSLNKTTLEKKAAEDQFINRVIQNVDKLFNAQISIAEGCSYLYRVDQIGEGSKKREEHVLVTDPEEIKAYLDGNTEDTYYYITTKTPDNKAIDSLMDRAFGKAVTKIAGTGDDGEVIVKIVSYGNNPPPQVHT